MKHSERYTGILFAGLMLVLILDGKTALSGARAGIELCLATVIPSLFPFFLISSAVTAVTAGLGTFLPASVCAALGIPRGAESLLVIGFLGGYPIGAQSVAQAVGKKRLARADGERMLAFCNNAGPAFLFGIGASLFPNTGYCWLVWAIQILSALAVALCTPGKCRTTIASAQATPFSLTAAMQRAVRTMGTVCGWVVFFKIVLAFVERWFFFLLPVNLRLLLSGLTELTNGCAALREVGSVGLKVRLFSLFCAFGGLCVCLQTRSVLADGNLCGKGYFQGKAAQAAFAYLLSVSAQACIPSLALDLPAPVFPLLAAAICASYFLWGKRKKQWKFPRRRAIMEAVYPRRFLRHENVPRKG